MCGGDVALHQIFLATCIIHYKHETWFVMCLCVCVMQNFHTFNLFWQIVLFSLAEWSSNIFRLMCFEVSLSVLVLSIKIVNEFTRVVWEIQNQPADFCMWTGTYILSVVAFAGSWAVVCWKLSTDIQSFVRRAWRHSGCRWAASGTVEQSAHFTEFKRLHFCSCENQFHCNMICGLWHNEESGKWLQQSVI